MIDNILKTNTNHLHDLFINFIVKGVQSSPHVTNTGTHNEADRSPHSRRSEFLYKLIIDKNLKIIG